MPEFNQGSREVIERAIRFIETGSHTQIARDTMTDELRKVLAAPVAVELPTEAEIHQAWATYSQKQRVGKPMVGAFVLSMLERFAPLALEIERLKSALKEANEACASEHRDRELARAELQRRYDAETADGRRWFWQGDGSDHLESMVNGMQVIIGAAQLRELLAPAASAQQDEREAELLALLKSIRPQYGTVGSRDKDVTELRAKIDHAIRLLSTAQQVQADAGAVAIVQVDRDGRKYAILQADQVDVGDLLYTRPAAESVHPDHLKLLRPFMSARDGRLAHSLTVYLREMADPEFAKRTHEARKRLYGAAAESDKRDAERWRTVTRFVSAWLSGGRRQVWSLEALPIPAGVNLIKGSVAQHFADAVDRAAMSREQSGEK